MFVRLTRPPGGIWIDVPTASGAAGLIDATSNCCAKPAQLKSSITATACNVRTRYFRTP